MDVAIHSQTTPKRLRQPQQPNSNPKPGYISPTHNGNDGSYAQSPKLGRRRSPRKGKTNSTQKMWKEPQQPKSWAEPTTYPKHHIRKTVVRPGQLRKRKYLPSPPPGKGLHTLRLCMRRDSSTYARGWTHNHESELLPLVCG